MSTITGTVDESLDDATIALGTAAARLGYTLDEQDSGAGLLVFKKGFSGLRVELTAVSDDETELVISSDETFAIGDWGRGGVAAIRLLEAIGAHPESSESS